MILLYVLAWENEYSTTLKVSETLRLLDFPAKDLPELPLDQSLRPISLQSLSWKPVRFESGTQTLQVGLLCLRKLPQNFHKNQDEFTFQWCHNFFCKKKTVYLRKSQNTPMEVRRRYRSARHGKPVRWSRDSSVFRSKSHTLRGRRKLCRRVLGRNFHLDSHKNKHMW